MKCWREKALSGKARSGTRSGWWRNSVKMSSLVTVDRRPEVMGEGGGARKLIVFWDMGSVEIAG